MVYKSILINWMVKSIAYAPVSQTQFVVHLEKAYFEPQGQMTSWLQGQIWISNKWS